MKHNVDEQLIMGRTGHRSLSAVREYKRPDYEVQKKISDMLQPPKPKPTTVTCTATSSESLEDANVVSSSVVSSFTEVKETVKAHGDSHTLIKVRKGDQEVEIVLK